MFESMTGYGSHEKDGLKVELRSLNHRFLNINIKTSSLLMKYEMDLRSMVKNFFSRGQIDVYVSFTPEQAFDISFNEEMTKKVVSLLKGVNDSNDLSGDISIENILSFKDSILTKENSIDEELLNEVFLEALTQLKSMRELEGKKLHDEIVKYLSSIKELVTKIITINSGSSERLKDKYSSKIRDLIDNSSGIETRLYQEIAFILQKADISEELDRIGSHLSQFIENLDTDHEIGKKLDFLLQELNRETNTISSKTDEHAIKALVVDLKNEIEKVKEQVQNLQ